MTSEQAERLQKAGYPIIEGHMIAGVYPDEKQMMEFLASATQSFARVEHLAGNHGWSVTVDKKLIPTVHNPDLTEALVQAVCRVLESGRRA